MGVARRCSCISTEFFFLFTDIRRKVLMNFHIMEGKCKQDVYIRKAGSIRGCPISKFTDKYLRFGGSLKLARLPTKGRSE